MEKKCDATSHLTEASVASSIHIFLFSVASPFERGPYSIVKLVNKVVIVLASLAHSNKESDLSKNREQKKKRSDALIARAI